MRLRTTITAFAALVSISALATGRKMDLAGTWQFQLDSVGTVVPGTVFR